jgi:type IV pilus assembly protein PilB
MKKIGETLVAAGLIDQELLGQALKLQQGKRKRLGKILLEMGCVEEHELAEALALQLEIPLAECDRYPVTKELLATVPKETAVNKMVFPLEQQGKTLLLAMADPCDLTTMDEIAFRTGLKISPAVATETCIHDLLEKHYGSAARVFDLIKQMPASEGAEFIRETVADEARESVSGAFCNLSEAPPIVKLVTIITTDAVKYRASDIHIEPMEHEVLVRYRIDGELRNILKYPRYIHDSVTSRVKIIANLDITNRRLPQDGRSTLAFQGRKVDLRISTLPSVHGEKMVIRLLDRSTGIVPLGRLGVHENILTPLVELISRPQGMLIVTGPTGSGKTTSLYAILQQLQTEADNLITIEDPVEYKLDGITQVGVNEAVGLSFATALRSILRQDPDIIMIGEIRDRDTAEIAARAALTGHFVLSTLHTNDTVATIARLLDIGLEPFLVMSAVSGILAQRLIRCICPKCKVQVAPPEDIIKGEFPPLGVCYKGLGCKECHYTGYLGRVGVYEFLSLNAGLKKLIARHATEEELWEAARTSGMVSLFDDAWAKVAAGITSVEEVITKVPCRYHDKEPAKSEAIYSKTA